MATSRFAMILLSLRAQGLVEWASLISRTLAIASKHFWCNGHAHGDKRLVADHYAAMVGLSGFETSYPHALSGEC
jgi:ABC-type nitrate/sulfonate/bicarbonate transport system ATPase subunit